jgi:hypothetical protein
MDVKLITYYIEIKKIKGQRKQYYIENRDKILENSKVGSVQAGGKDALLLGSARRPRRSTVSEGFVA